MVLLMKKGDLIKGDGQMDFMYDDFWFKDTVTGLVRNAYN